MLPEAQTRAEINTVASAELRRFDAQIQDLKVMCLAHVGVTELSEPEFDVIAFEVNEAADHAKEVLIKLMDNGVGQDVIESAQVLLRNKVKQSIHPLEDDSLKTASGEVVKITNLNIHRFFELLLEFSIELERGHDPDKLQAAYLAARHSDAGLLHRDLQGTVDAKAATHPELSRQNYEPMPTVLEYQLQPNEMAALAKVLKKSGKKADWLSATILTQYNQQVSDYDEAGVHRPPKKLTADRIKNLTELRVALEHLRDEQNSVSTNLYTAGFEPLDRTIGAEKQDQILINTINIILEKNSRLGEEKEVEQVLKGWRQMVDRTRVEGLTITSYLQSVQRKLSGGATDFTQELANLDYLLQQLEIYRLNIPAVKYADPTGTFNTKVADAKSAYLTELEAKINEVKGKLGVGGAVVVPGFKELSIDEIYKADVEKLSTEQLYAAAKKLWGGLFRGTEVSKSNNKAKENARYDQILQVLGQKKEKLTGVEKEILQCKINYLKDKRTAFDAMCIGTSSAMTLDYDSFLKGDGRWLGAGTPAGLEAIELLRLTYGTKLNPDVLDSPDSEERERIKTVNELLNIMADFYGDYTLKPKKGSNGITVKDSDGNDILVWTKGDFHATSNFGTAKIDEFKKAIAKKWRELRRIPDGQSLTPSQEEAFELSWWLGALFDLRTFYALPFYMAGWSPQDDIVKTIGKTAERVANGKTLYVICGKGQSLIDPPAIAARPSQKVYDAAADTPDKRDILDFSVNHATPIWWGFMATHLDEGLGEMEESLKVTPQLDNDAYVPAMHAAFFVPSNSGMDTVTRDKLISSATTGEKDAINVQGILSGSLAAQEFANACLDGFVPSGDPHKDIELIKDKASEIANKISPTKALSTTNGRILANYLYSYCRMALVSFGKKYSEKMPSDDYQRAYAEFLMALRSGIGTAETNKIAISDHLIPAEFRDRYGLPKIDPDPNSKFKDNITILTYVHALLPDGRPIPGFGGGTFYVTPYQQDKKKPLPAHLLPEPVSAEVAKRILASAKYDALREKNNKELLDHAQGKAHTYRQMMKQKLEQRLMGGNSSPLLNHHHMFSPQGSKTQVVFYSAMRMPDFADKDKGPKE